MAALAHINETKKSPDRPVSNHKIAGLSKSFKTTNCYQTTNYCHVQLIILDALSQITIVLASWCLNDSKVQSSPGFHVTTNKIVLATVYHY